MNKPIYKYKDWILDSYLEVFFCYYLQELQDNGFIDHFEPHVSKWDITPTFTRKYLKQLKTKSIEAEYHLLHGGSYTADFSILFTSKAANIFYLDPSKPVKNIKNIPFRLSRTDGSLVCHVEIKSTNESTTSSSYSFAIWQKVIMKDFNEYVQKIQPFSLDRIQSKKTLFHQTFYPQRVLNSQVYKVNCSGGRVGETRIKHEYKTFKQFINEA